MVESVGRVFVAIGLAHEVRAAIASYVSELSLPGSVVPPENLHITLRFLGEVDDVSFDRLLAGLDQSHFPAPFRLRVGGVGAFPSTRNATVAWLGVEDDSALYRLWETVDEVCDAAGLGREERPFRPHLTVARLRPPVDLGGPIAAAPGFSVKCGVDAVTVFRSEKARGTLRYRPLERFALDGPSR